MLLRASRTRERFGVESPVGWRKKAAKPIVTSWFSVLNDHIVADSRVRSRERRPACHPFVSFLERGALSRVRARVHGRTHSRDGSRASRRTRRRRAETGRDRAVGTGAFSRSRGPRSRRKRRVRGKAAPSLFAHTTAFSVDVRARDSPLDPTPLTNAGQRRARLQRHHGGTRGHGLARTRARAPHRSGTSSTDELSDAPSRHLLNQKKPNPTRKLEKLKTRLNTPRTRDASLRKLGTDSLAPLPGY